MDFSLTPALKSLQDEVRTFIAEQIIPLEKDPRQTAHGPSEELREELGLKDSFVTQYARFLGKALQSDLGTSYFFKEPALDVILKKLPATLELVYENDSWMISVIDVDASGLRTSGGMTANGYQPGKDSIESLVKRSVGGWADSLQRDDFEYFAEFWMEGAPPEKLREGFGGKGFSAEELREFKAATPVINDTQMRADGVLMVESEVGSGPSKVRMRFQFEPIGESALDWKIVSLNVDRKE